MANGFHLPAGLLLSLVGLLQAWPAMSAGNILPSEAALLQKAAKSFRIFPGGETWTGSNCSTWRGVICGAGSVIEIDLSRSPSFASIEGTIPPEIFLLPRLTRLAMNDNVALKGPIPSTLAQANNLEFLDLRNISINGPLPDVFKTVTQLGELDLSYSNVSGKLPKSIGYLGLLTNLVLDGNSFTGPVPTEIGNCQYLIRWRMGNNRVTSLPESMGSMKFLLTLDIRNNLITSLPVNISSLTFLNELIASGNKIKRSLPSSIGNLKQLQLLVLGQNQITRIPASLAALENLQSLVLSNNNLKGGIPDIFGKMGAALTNLDLHGNSLSGTLPGSLSRLLKLQNLVVHHNRLSGVVPSSIFSLPILKLLDLSSNQFTGTLPTFPSDRLPSKGLFRINDNYFVGDATIRLASKATVCLSQSPSTLEGLPLQKSSLENNCLSYAKGTRCLREPQRKALHCMSFCGASLPAGACAGHGVCSRQPGRMPACQCAKGFKVASAQFGKYAYSTCSAI